MVLGRTVYLLAVAAVFQEVSGYAPDISELFKVRIYNGHWIPIEEAPYMAALQRIKPGKGPGFFCGASIIHERFLLTAAHCFELKGQESLKNLPTIASMGSRRYMYTRTNTIIKIEKILCHEGFNETSKLNDICLLKLKKPVRFSKRIAKIKLADKNFNVTTETEVNVSGWGMTEGFRRTLDLLRTTIPVLSNKYCQKADNSIDDTMICAGVKGNGACYGDSGGPLVYNNVQVGVTSRLIEECGTGMEVYTKVNSHLDWIHTTIAKHL